jgi:transcriptional regulator with XRE-family HTH domain
MQTNPAPLASIVAFNVRRLRQLRGFSQIALAERSGVDRTGLNQLEGEFRGATLSTIERLADALAVAPWQLLKKPAGATRQHKRASRSTVTRHTRAKRPHREE